MRIYNGTNSTLSLPLNANQRISIDPKSVSGNILATDVLLGQIATNFTPKQVAIVIAGPHEMITYSKYPIIHEYVTHTLEDAIERLCEKEITDSNTTTCECETPCKNCTGNCTCDVEKSEDKKPNKVRNKKSTEKSENTDKEE